MVLEHAGAPYPEQETERQGRVDELCLTSQNQDAVFDRLVQLTAACLKVPIALVSILDNKRQWFLARAGLDIQETPRNQSFCGYAILQSFPLQVPDALADPRFRDNPLVTGEPRIRFYAGIPLITEDGLALGSLCIIDTVPRPELNASELAILQKLADLVMSRIASLRERSYVDSTTGLFNSARLSRDISEQQKRFTQGHVIMIDVFELLYVKDMVKALGYGLFNDLQVETTHTLKALLPPDAQLYKASPTRFAVWLENASAGVCAKLSGRLLETLKQPIIWKDIPIQTQVAIGILPLNSSLSNQANWLRRSISTADYARGLRERIAWFQPELESAHQRTFALLGGIAPALLADDQLRLEYQPKISLSSGRCTGLEALLRWTHPELGRVGPDEFIPLAEKTTLIHELTLWVVNKAVLQLKEWQSQGLNLTVSINISAGDLETPLFAEQLLEQMQRYGIQPGEIELEFTESVLMSDPQAVKEQLERLTQLGINVAIDDFGTGYSNWAYLRQLPASTLKIDKSFIDGIQKHEADRLMVTAIIELAHKLNYKVIAEGVETQEDFNLLAEWGCDQVQGYLVAKPMPPDALPNWLAKRAEPANSK